jgi:hypothetical protein
MADDVAVARSMILLELSNFRKELATLGPATGDAAKDMSKALLIELKKIEAGAKATATAAAKESAKAAEEAKKTAKAAGKTWNEVAKNMQSNQMISDMEQIGSMFILVGGNVSKAAMLFTSAVRPIAMVSELFGPQAMLMLGLAAIPALGLAAISAIRGLADSGLAARDHLKELGYTVGPEQQDALKSYEHAVAQLDVTMSRLKVSVGEQAAPAIDQLTTALNILARSAQAQLEGGDQSRLFGVIPMPGDPVFDGLRWMRERLLEVSDGFLTLSNSIATLGGTYGFTWLMEVLGRTTNEEIRQREEAYALAEAQIKVSQEVGQHAAAQKKLAEDAEKATKAMQENMEWMAKGGTDAYVALGMLVSVQEQDKAAKDAQTQAARASAEAERLRGQYIQGNEAILREYEQAQADAARADKKRAGELEQRLEAERKHYLEFYRVTQAAQNEEAAAAAIRDEAVKAANSQIVADTAAAAAQVAAAWATTWATDATAFAEMTQERIDQGRIYNEAQRDSAAEEYGRMKNMALGAFAAQQATALASATVAAYQAGAGAVAALSSVGVPPPFSLIAGAALTATMLGGQVATIASADAPQIPELEFPTGLSSDHYMAGLQRGELVASRRAAAMPEVREAIDAGNEGRRPTARAERVEVSVSVDRRTGRLRVRQSRPGKKDRRR